ncbi:hypothetical protein [Microvirga sp. 2TAF3]|uniref:hypothetical protein n=1 Tax=Microvirga sp. 2TAF3 TaxID=3233014 RepID=UPI003F9B8CB7
MTGARDRGLFLRPCLRHGRSRTVLTVFSVGAWLLGTSAISAHDWYPAWCCSDKDCRPLSEEKGETVSEAPDGWHLWDGRIVDRLSAKPSPDTRFHLCEEATTKAIICFFVPPGSS